MSQQEVKKGCVVTALEQFGIHSLAMFGIFGSKEVADSTNPISSSDSLVAALDQYSAELNLENLIPDPDHLTLNNTLPWLAFVAHTIIRHSKIPESSNKLTNAVKQVDEYIHPSKHSSIAGEITEGVIDAVSTASILAFPFVSQLLPELIKHSDSHPAATAAFSLLLAIGGVQIFSDIIKEVAILKAKNEPKPIHRYAMPGEKEVTTVENRMQKKPKPKPPQIPQTSRTVLSGEDGARVQAYIAESKSAQAAHEAAEEKELKDRIAETNRLAELKRQALYDEVQAKIKAEDKARTEPVVSILATVWQGGQKKK